MKLPRPTYASVAATLALVVALSGSAYAAGLARNSVGAKQLKPQAVTTAKLKQQAVTTEKLKLGAVGAAQLDPALLGALSDGIANATPVFVNATTGGIQQIQTTSTILANVTLPTAGTYFVAINLRAFPRASNPGHNLFCSFGDVTLTNVLLQGTGVTQVPMTGATVVNGSQDLSLVCNTSSAEITVSYDISALRVGPTS